MLTNEDLAQAVITGHRGHQHHDVEDTLRGHGPVHQALLPSGLRISVITAGYERTRALLADPALSKDSDRLAAIIRAQLGPGELTAMHGPSMLMSDPPRHTRLRHLVSAAFTPHRVAELRPRIERITRDLLDAADTSRPVDLVRAIAYSLPITVICELLGAPAADHHQLREWTEQLMGDDETVTVPASQAMTGYLHDLITDTRRRGDTTGLLGALAATGTTDRLTPDELIAMAMLLIVAGHETTTNLIGNTVYALLTEPARWQAVSERPELVPAAIEETLRWDPPVRHATHRTSTRPIDVDGQTLPADEVVLINLGAAGRDPATTPHAHTYDLHRSSSTHTSFGHGIHFCLGAPLARMEAEISLTQLTTRWPHARLATANPPGRTDSAIMNGLTKLLITARC
ncbi:cytochrome P450 family protein [Lentzea sp. CA-135723]|uniref:cytochrome P450 family protein n=1 Tax=Lentzea sp. CA-135723 TaxID=3239950 RepID=UPI003D8FD55D